MKKKRIATAAAAITLSMAMGATVFAMPNDIGGHWAQSTITQWTSKGYISGYPDGTFKPDNSITRAEFVVLVNKAMGYTKKGNAYFKDLSSSHWAYNEIMKGVSAGYISGDASGTFRPDDPVSRQEAAVMISKILDLGKNPAAAAKFVDYRFIPAWSVGYVGSVTEAGIMSGYPDGDFKADRVLTRAEAVVSLDGVSKYDGKTDEEKEDYTLTATMLSNKTIDGDLIISGDLKTKSVKLDNVTVKGTVIVKGGASVTANDCDIKNLEMDSDGTGFISKGNTTVKNTTFKESGSIQGDGYDTVTVDKELSDRITVDAEINEFVLDAETDVRLLSNTVIKNFTATKNADNANVSFSKAEVKDMDIYDKIKITGSGDIDTMTVYVSGVQSTIKPDDLNQKNGADKPDYIQGGSSGEIEHGGSSSRYDDYTITKDGKTVRNGKYDDVTIKADDVTLDGTVIYGDLTIHKDVKNGTVTLEDVTVKGDVYVYGGGDDSVIFDGCDIRGDIIADKTVTSKPVNLKFKDSTDVDGKIRVRNNTIIESTYKLDGIVLDDRDADLELKTDTAYVEFAKKGELTVNNCTVDTVTVGSSADDSVIIMKNGAVIKNLNAKEDVSVKGTGTIEKISGSGDVTKENGITVGVAVTGVKLDKTEANVTVDGQITLKATVSPDNAGNKEVEWSSSDSTIASVDNNGVVTGHKAGTATITVKTKDGGKTATCKVTVTDKVVAVTEVKLDKTTAEMKVGDTLTLTATVTPDNATNKKVTWKSDKTDIADVDANGKVTAKAKGTATITVTTEDGGKTAKCVVTVDEKAPETVPVTGITLDKTELTLKVGETYQLKHTLNPENATNKNVTWSGNNYVNVTGQGLVTAKKVTGDNPVDITVTTQEGNFTATCKVTVTAADKTELETAITEAESAKTDIAVSTDGSDVEPTKKWVTQSEMDSFDNAITDAETVKNNNNATAEQITEAITALNGAKEAFVKAQKAGTKETVVKVDSVTLNNSSLTLTVDETATLTATVTPENATNKEIKWESNNQSIATVDENGTVTAVGEGTATITATADGVKAECTVTVNKAKPTVTGVVINGVQDNGLVEKNGTLTMSATVNMSDNTTNNNVKWSSGNNGVATIDETSGVVTFVGTGSVTFTAKAAADESKTASVTINVYEVTITGNTTLTEGTNTTLTVGVNGITGTPTFAWSFTGTTPDGLTLTNANTNTVSIQGVKADTYNVKVDITVNGQTVSKTVVVTVTSPQA
ncbi:MAG: Ig-like domain-containing protein [Christensenellales bacterium]